MSVKREKKEKTKIKREIQMISFCSKEEEKENLRCRSNNLII